MLCKTVKKEEKSVERGEKATLAGWLNPETLVIPISFYNLKKSV